MIQTYLKDIGFQAVEVNSEGAVQSEGAVHWYKTENGGALPDADGETITCILLDLTTNDYEKLFSVKSAAAFDTEKTELIKGTAASAISLKGALQAYVDDPSADSTIKTLIQNSGVLN